MGYPEYETKQINKNETTSTCIIDNKKYKKGNGNNKKEAEQHAAELTCLGFGLE